MFIRDKDRLALIEIFKTSPFTFEIWAYGSRVTGSAHNTSDLDLVLRTENLNAMPFEEFTKMVDKIQNSTIPILVELRDWAKMPDSFKTQIVKQYEVLHQNYSTSIASTSK